MQIFILTLLLLTSGLTIGQSDDQKEIIISREEAINIAQHKGYNVRSTKLDSNQWRVTHYKLLGYTKGGRTPVYKNITTTIDANTGKIKKRSRFNSMNPGLLDNDLVPTRDFKKKKKVRVWGERVTVYY